MSTKAKNQTVNDAVMTPREAMKIMKVSRDTFYRLLTDGKVPGAFKFGGQWRIDTDAFWDAVRRQSTN